MKRAREEGTVAVSAFDLHFFQSTEEGSVPQWKEWGDTENKNKGFLSGLHAATSTNIPTEMLLAAGDVPLISTVICRLTRRKAPAAPQHTDLSPSHIMNDYANALVTAIKSFLLTTPIISSEDEAANCVDNSGDVRDCLRRRHEEYSPYPSLTETQLDVVDVYYCSIATTINKEREGVPSPPSSILISVLAFARNARPRQTYLQLFLTAVGHRKLGVGKALMYVALDAEFALSETSAIWLHTMNPIDQSHSASGILDVDVTNRLISAVQRLYTEVGFQIRRTLKGYYAHPVEDLRLCMEEARKKRISVMEAVVLASEFKRVEPVPSQQPPIPRIDGVEMTLTRGDYIKYLPQRRRINPPR